ncbi:MAG: hypothetical protein Q9M30_05800, partial [Mariprofundaceae bacterium]|nr:hypothetical protein [Mariprofundaceae bacterium]
AGLRLSAISTNGRFVAIPKLKGTLPFMSIKCGFLVWLDAVLGSQNMIILQSLTVRFWPDYACQPSAPMVGL